MQKKIFRDELNLVPFIILKLNRVVEVNKCFLDLTGYNEEEVLGRSIKEIFAKLKVTPNYDLCNLGVDKNYFIFVKTFDYREVTIKITHLPNDGGVKVLFLERNNSRFSDSFKFLNSLIQQEITACAIYTVPNFVLLKANNLYINFFNKPFNCIENILGKEKHTFFPNWKGSKGEAAWENIIHTGKALHIREYKYEHKERGTTYWDCIITPIYEEGKIKYLVSNCINVTEKVVNKKKIEEQNSIIQQQKKQLETIIENISDGIFILDENKKFNLLNKGAREFFYKPDDIERLGDSFSNTEYYGVDGSKVLLDNVPERKIINGKDVQGSIVTLKRPDGIFHFEISGNSITDDNGKTVMKIFCTRNITEKVRQDELIKEQKKELETIIENISDYLFIFDKNKNFIRVNKCLLKKLQNIEVKKVGDFGKVFEYYDTSGERYAQENLPMSRVLKGEEVENEVIIQKGRSVRYFNINAKPVLDDNGNFKMGIVNAKDITTDVLHKKSVERQALVLEKLIYNLDLPLIRMSYPDLKITDINQGAYKILKALKPEIKSIGYVIGENYSSVISNFDESKMRHEIEKILNKQETSYSKYKKLILNGEETFVNILYQPLFGVNGNIEEIVAVIIDITKELKAKQKIETNLRMQEELFANISHELKTPLNIIYSIAQLFSDFCKNGSLDEKKNSIIKYLNTLMQNCYRLSKLVNNIVDLSKIDAGFYELKKSNYNIVSVVEDVVMSSVEYSVSKGLEVIFDTNIEEKTIACDPSQIERVLLNLISNAIKFSNAGGKIHVDFFDKGDWVEISVRDTGIGIDKSQIDKIFDRFKQVDKSFSRNTEGTGIGLSIVKAIVELHGGKITVESELGKGSKFKVVLPADKTEVCNPTADESYLENSSEKIHIEFSDIY
ncbi:MAG: ATP-binding protein [Bacillota bacterium]|nr:ATP-binding protein [Bacillota bacterium]